MSVRAVAVRGTASARLRVLPRAVPVRPFAARWGVRPGLVARWRDDRDLVPLKLCLLVMLLLVGVALEVPL